MLVAGVLHSYELFKTINIDLNLDHLNVNDEVVDIDNEDDGDKIELDGQNVDIVYVDEKRVDVTVDEDPEVLLEMNGLMTMLVELRTEKMQQQRNDETEDKLDLMIDVKVQMDEVVDSDIGVDEIDDVQRIMEHDDADETVFIEKLVNDDIEKIGTPDDIDEMVVALIIEIDEMDEILIKMIILDNDDIDDILYGEIEVRVEMLYEVHSVEIITEVLDEIDDVLYIEIEVTEESLLIDIILIVVLDNECDIDVNEYDEM